MLGRFSQALRTCSSPSRFTSLITKAPVFSPFSSSLHPALPQHSAFLGAFVSRLSSTYPSLVSRLFSSAHQEVAIASTQELYSAEHSDPVVTAKLSVDSLRDLRTQSWRVLDKLTLKYPFPPIDQIPDPTGPSGWSPAAEKAVTSHLPFQISRAGKGAVNFPVYLRPMNGRTRIVTIVRKFTGDGRELLEELRNLVGRDKKVRLLSGKIEINGPHKALICSWMQRLGF